MSELGALVATGRTAQVYAWGDARVVKIFEEQVTDPAIAREQFDSAAAYDAGLTPIACHERVTLPDGRRGLVFDRLEGPSLTHIAERDPRKIRKVAGILAAEHARLHEHSGSEFRDVREFAVSLLHSGSLAQLSADERQRLREHLRALPAGESVLHLDFHPLNVFSHHHGYAVIDWQSTCRGAAAADVAMTRLLFTEAELFPGISWAQRLLYQSARRVMFAFYGAEYRRLTEVSRADVEQWATAVRVLRLGLLDVASEREELLARIRGALQETRV